MTTANHIDLGLRDVDAGCACCATEPGLGHKLPGITDVSSEALVTGMTCSHCVASITDELVAIEDVTHVSVDLHTGGTSRVTIHSSSPVDAADVEAAVDEAGYSLVGYAA